ncbi:hypothetical protein IIA16_06265 [bacterium]|nr:hypothetical protein [bacterium]
MARASGEISVDKALLAGWHGAKRHWTAFLPVLLLSAVAFLPILWLLRGASLWRLPDENLFLAARNLAFGGDAGTLVALTASLVLMVYATLLATRLALDVRDLPARRASLGYMVGSWFASLLLWTLAYRLALGSLETYTEGALWLVVLAAASVQVVGAVRLQFVPYIIVEGEGSPWRAAEASWRLTAGHSWKLLWFLILVLAMGIAGLLALVVGVFFAIPVANVAQADLFRQLTGAPEPAEAGSGAPDSPAADKPGPPA